MFYYVRCWLTGVKEAAIFSQTREGQSHSRLSGFFTLALHHSFLWGQGTCRRQNQLSHTGVKVRPDAPFRLHGWVTGCCWGTAIASTQGIFSLLAEQHSGDSDSPNWHANNLIADGHGRSLPVMEKSPPTFLSSARSISILR